MMIARRFDELPSRVVSTIEDTTETVAAAAAEAVAVAAMAMAMARVVSTRG